MSEHQQLHLFEGFGIELEYMIVDRQTLDVKPVCDSILQAEAGDVVLEVQHEHTAWSNELALHVIEMKTNGPAAELEPYRAHFQHDVESINTLLSAHGAMLMPSGQHPWMNPAKESVLWPHEQTEIYSKFNEIFNCKGHGWTNLQSMHINLPFGNDAEFNLLHQAIRFLLPIMPALTASSPFVEGQATGILDNRLAIYADNCKRIPLVTAGVIPTMSFSQADYQENVLRPMYAQISELDPEKILQHEWLNARGAIARFDRNAIEIRILDTQEHPAADLGVAGLIVDTLKALIGEHWAAFSSVEIRQDLLVDLYRSVVREGYDAVVEDADYLAAFGLQERKLSVKELWAHIIETGAFEQVNRYHRLLQRGNLSSRLLRYFDTPTPSRDALLEVYRELCQCLREGKYFN